ncbi:helix-turn-helix domain-containing protein [Bradyrhizobium septentrionale]|uniref:helix-turn-helix domain-containing protein n=1 Tax=Bradyrhizobium septentrionale TaxID=1404411 RepID=UPI001596444F|nr:helix-turn-helix transcriptional regulator [Bradyrhizobium septentrionale]UGY23830.1 helix-turn-helix domain-containing protein [Bradyrhizobium septentrionale]
MIADGRRRTGSSRLKNPPPENSIRYYRQRKGLTLKEVATLLGTTHQTIQRLEELNQVLTPDWAMRIGSVLGGIPGALIAYSDDEDAYPWAARPIPVMGVIDERRQIELQQEPLYRVGLTNRPTGTVAIEVRDRTMLLDGWLLLYDDTQAEPITDDIIARQANNERFVCRLTDGTVWVRRIVPAANGLHHLETDHAPPIYDAHVKSVALVLGFERPGQDLPPR